MSVKLPSLSTSLVRKALAFTAPALAVGLILVSQAQALTARQLRQIQQQRLRQAELRQGPQIIALESKIRADFAREKLDVALGIRQLQHATTAAQLAAARAQLRFAFAEGEVIDQELKSLNARFGHNRLFAAQIRLFATSLNRQEDVLESKIVHLLSPASGSFPSSSIF